MIAKPLSGRYIFDDSGAEDCRTHLMRPKTDRQKIILLGPASRRSHSEWMCGEFQGNLSEEVLTMKYLALYLLFLVSYRPVAFSQPLPDKPLGEYLNTDGTLHLPSGFSGTLNARGWKMRTAPNGTPRFTPSVLTDAADAAWDMHFISGDLHLRGDVSSIAVRGNLVYIGGALRV